MGQVSSKTKNAVGRPPKFKTPEDLRMVYLEWRELFQMGQEKFGEIPDVEGFCDYIGAWRDLLHAYESKPDYSHTIKEIKNWIYYRKKQLAMAGRMNPAVFIFDAKNNAGYTDKTEVESTGEQKIIVETRQANAPKLIEHEPDDN